MTMLIISEDSHGIRRACNATCYNAKGTCCACICGGINHGKGENIATTFTEHLYDMMAMQIKIRFPDVKRIIFYQENLELAYNAQQLKPDAHEHPTQTDRADGNEPDR